MSKKISRSESEYMLLFRGTSWHQGLSSETVQAVMNQYDWFEQLVEQGRATSGRPLAYQGKIVSGKKGHTVIDGPSSNPRKRSVAICSFMSQMKGRRSKLPSIARDWNTASRWKFDLSWNSALRASLRLKPPSSCPVELASDKPTTEPKWRSLEGPSVKRPATFTGASARAPLQICEFSVQRDHQCRRDHSWLAQEFPNDEADVVSAETKRVAHGEAHLFFTSGPGDII